jgi:hypothetical protein
MERRAIYVAGPMAGLPEHNFPAFRRAALRLRTAGYWVISPHEIPLPCGCSGLPPQCGAPDHAWSDLLRADLVVMLSDAGAVALLPGWEKSRGATLEVHVAARLGIPVKPLDDWLQLALASTKE